MLALLGRTRLLVHQPIDRGTQFSPIAAITSTVTPNAPERRMEYH